MKYRVLACVVAGLALPEAAGAQGMWWVEGDRYCSDFGNRSRNGAMCGNARRGETEPRPTLRYQFNLPRVPLLEGQGTEGNPGTIIPAPSDRPPTRRPQ